MKLRKSTQTLIALATMALTSPAFADLQPLTGGSLVLRYSSEVAAWMQTPTETWPSPYSNIDFFDASYNTVQQDAFGGGFALSANPRLEGTEGWDQAFNFSFNLSETVNPSWRSTVQQTNTFQFEDDNGVLVTSGSVGLSGAIRVDNGSTYVVYGDYLLREYASGILTLDNFMGFSVPDAFRLVINPLETISTGNSMTLSGELTYGNPAVSYFFQGYPGPAIGTFELTLQTVPEPSALALLGISFGILALRRRR